MNPFVIVGIIVLWGYILRVLTRAKLNAWRFMWGSIGLFVILLVLVQPILTEPLARCVSALAGIVGNLTKGFSAYFKYGIIFVQSAGQSLTLQVDFECSGIIEIMAFISLLTFFNVYSVGEKIMVGIGGFVYIMVCNTLRIVIICMSVQWFGPNSYYFVHTYVGRIFFYILSMLLYFYVFTKPQILKMKVGSFNYGNNESNS